MSSFSPSCDRDQVAGNSAKSENSSLYHGKSSPSLCTNALVRAEITFWLSDYQCANTGYTEGKVNFSCRAPRRSKDDPHYTGPPDLIGFLKSCIPACEELSPGWGDRVGHDFARGHREVSYDPDLYSSFVSN